MLIILLLPTLIFYLGLSSSMALGTTFAAALVLLIVIVDRPRGPERTSKTLVRPGRVLATIGTLCVVLMIHLAVASIESPIQATRALASMIPLALLITGAASLAGYLQRATPAEVHRAMQCCFFFLTVIALLGVVGLFPTTGRFFIKPVFPFTEPSHFALAFTPFLLYVCVTSTGRRRMAYLLVGFALAALLQNLTLVIACTLATLVSLQIGRLVVFVAIFAIAAGQFDLSYFADRLNFSAETQNLSSLVYLQGWQLIAESWRNSAGIGLGFQQLGTQGTGVGAADLIQAILGDDLNLLDGGFTLAKILGEFGYLGIALCAAYLLKAWHSARVLRKFATSDAGASPVEVFAHCAVTGYLVEMFVRGTGYFTATGLLLVAGLWLTARRSSVAKLRRGTRPHRSQKSALSYEVDP